GRHDDRRADRHGGDRLHDRHHRHLCASRQHRVRRIDPPDPRGSHPMIRARTLVATLLALVAAGGAFAAGADLGQAAKQATNWTAISMFGAFVLLTLWITKRAAARTRSAAEFYTAGGGITGFQNGLAI